MEEKPMTSRKSWEEFRASGLLWFVNRILHVFGWSIAVEIDQDDPTQTVRNAYPIRTKFRGFDEASETQGFNRLGKYAFDNAQTIFVDDLKE